MIGGCSVRRVISVVAVLGMTPGKPERRTDPEGPIRNYQKKRRRPGVVGKKSASAERIRFESPKGKCSPWKMRSQPELGYTWYQGRVISVCAKTILIPSLQWTVALNVAMIILLPISGKLSKKAD